jgi:hypothetical protein
MVCAQRALEAIGPAVLLDELVGVVLQKLNLLEGAPPQREQVPLVLTLMSEITCRQAGRQAGRRAGGQAGGALDSLLHRGGVDCRSLCAPAYQRSSTQADLLTYPSCRLRSAA